jgi:hypothetical protein
MFELDLGFLNARFITPEKILGFSTSFHRFDQIVNIDISAVVSFEMDKIPKVEILQDSLNFSNNI